jgi:hypothetical protein
MREYICLFLCNLTRTALHAIPAPQQVTGPRTPEGQARSSQNTRTHGLTARDLTIAAAERVEFEELLSACQNKLNHDR